MTELRLARPRAGLRGRAGRGVVAVCCALGLLAAGCGDDDSSSSDTTAAPGSTAGGGSATTAAGGAATTTATDAGCTTERAGGTVTFSAFIMTRSMDPTVSFGTASTGSIELAAVYDTLMQYDDASATFKPRVAESLTPNADFTAWTMKLRPGIKFGNGDPLTTNDVKASIARHIDPANGSTSRLDASNITDMEIKDDLTMVFHLKDSWGTFPYLLADNTGLIINPKVLTTMGKEAFGKMPTGAGVGPYEVTSFKPGELIELTAKKDYWGGPVCIQKIEVTDIPLEDATYDSLKLGEIDVMLTENPKVLKEAQGDGYDSHVELDHIGAFIMINNGVNGSKPATTDVRVRQAIAAAIDVKSMNDRLFDGDGMPSSTIILAGTPLDPGVPGPAFDQAKARSLVTAAKADGWDGEINLVCSANNPDVPLAIQGALEAVGMTVKTELLQPNEMVQRVNIEGNYEITCSGMVVFDASPYNGLARWFGAGNFFTGFNDPTFNAGMAELKKASTQAQLKTALGKLQTTWNQTVPSVNFGAAPWAQVWGERLHGLTFNALGGMYFSDAWLDK